MSATHGCRTDGYGKVKWFPSVSMPFAFPIQVFLHRCFSRLCFRPLHRRLSLNAFFRRMGNCDIFQFFRRINMGFRIGPSPVEDFSRGSSFQFDGIGGGERERTQTMSVHHGFYVFRNAPKDRIVSSNLFPSGGRRDGNRAWESPHYIYRCNSNNQLEFRLGHVFEMIEHFTCAGSVRSRYSVPLSFISSSSALVPG